MMAGVDGLRKKYQGFIDNENQKCKYFRVQPCG